MMLTMRTQDSVIHTQDRSVFFKVEFHKFESDMASDFNYLPFELSLHADGDFCLLGWMDRNELEALHARLTQAIEKHDENIKQSANDEMVERSL